MKPSPTAYTIVIGAAPEADVRHCLTALRSLTPGEHFTLLAPVRDKPLENGSKAYPADQVLYFQGPLYWHNSGLLRAFLRLRPRRVVIACGLHYDHDNVLAALDVLAGLALRTPEVSLHARGKLLPARRPRPWRALSGLAKLGPLTLAAGLLVTLRPWRLIRIGRIYAERIGHLAMDCEIALCQRDLALVPPRCVDVYYVKDDRVSNHVLLRLFKRQMPIRSWFALAEEAVHFFKLDPRRLHVMTTHKVRATRDVQCLMQQTKPHLAFSAQEERQGRHAMEELGLDPTRPFVCLLGRDPAYLKMLARQTGQPSNASDNHYRNMDIQCFAPAVRALAESGLQTIRMGHIVKEPLDVDAPGFVDYAASGRRSEFMDIYLPARCRFFLGVPSGLIHVSMIFRVPCACVNMVTLEFIPSCEPRDITIFKKIWHKSARRFLTVGEILESGMGRWTVEKFHDPELELVENEAGDIRELAVEMQARLDGTWRTTPEDEALQHAFWRKFQPSDLNSGFHSRIGAAFLRRHARDLGVYPEE